MSVYSTEYNFYMPSCTILIAYVFIMGDDVNI
jgi:hypothetical protein